MLLADYLIGSLNTAGSVLLVATTWIVSLYLVSTFTMEKFMTWLAPLVRVLSRIGDRWTAWREHHEQRKQEKRAARLEKARERQARRSAVVAEPIERPKTRPMPPEPPREDAAKPEVEEIPICALEDTPPWEAPAPVATPPRPLA